MIHDHYSHKNLSARNRRANSKWMGNAKSTAFSSDTWSRNHKREFNAVGRKCGDARDVCATVNTLGTTFGDAIMASTGIVLFSLANAISGTQVRIQKGLKNLNKPGKWRL